MLLLSLFAGYLAAAAPAAALPAVKVPDRLTPAAAGQVHVDTDSLLGARIAANITGRLKHAPIDEMLAGFRHRPGTHPWIGEHIGKWLHAAGLACQYSNDADLRKMMDDAVKALLATQLPDGYLGTYVDAERWTSWDVWSHKYNLIGLLQYYDVTGDAAALAGARKIGDLLVNTFGPGKRDIIEAGTHVGMAATSVLEPMVKLYRHTGDDRYLAFCKYLVDSWDQPKGPKVLASLLEHGNVSKTANGKAYEMMSNLVGLCELYRVVGDDRYLKACRNAWEDVRRHQTYITGGVSLNEHFQPDGHLPEIGHIAETCANVTWMQLCLELLAITGEEKFVEPVETLIYNHLLGAQAQDGNDWCYFTPLRTRKPFLDSVNCCHSSGPRGVAMIPTAIYGTSDRSLRINLYVSSTFKGEVPGAGSVELRQEWLPDKVRIQVKLANPAAFKLELREPVWRNAFILTLNGDPKPPALSPDGLATGISDPNRLAVIDRRWQDGDTLELKLDPAPRWIPGQGEHAGQLAVRNGPFILCASNKWNADLPPRWVVAADGAVQPTAAKGLEATVQARVLTSSGLIERTIGLGPFAMVQRDTFAVWLRTPEKMPSRLFSVLEEGQERSSRRGKVDGSIIDDDPLRYRVTSNSKIEESDFWQVTLRQPVQVDTIVFYHGHVFPDGGWFDTSAGKPEVLVQTALDGAWQSVGRLDAYPVTNAADPPGLTDGQPFEFKLAKPMRIFGVHITGKPAHGNEPLQAYSSCGELAAY